MEYLHWKEETITDFSEQNVSAKYAEGFVFTRINRGVMHQTRSVRIDLSKFELSSENRRILKKVEAVKMSVTKLPWKEYDWSVGKLGKDFYTIRTGTAVFSANKIKELMTVDHNFNLLLVYKNQEEASGYSICFKNTVMLHYCYPFYNFYEKDLGLGMMLKAIISAKEEGLRYVYLGSLQRPGDVYKLQFTGLEWFDGEKWNKNLEEVKKLLQALS